MKLNQSGSTQIFLCLTLLMALSGISTVTLTKLISLKNNRIRLKSLLCMRKSHYYQSKFIGDINQTNRLIQISYYASKAPLPQMSTPAKAALVSLKSLQQFKLIKFYKDIYKINECAKTTKANILLNSPYKMRAKVSFQRSFDQTTIVERTKKKYFYSINEKNVSLSNPLLLNSSIKVDNKFSKEVKIFTKVYEI